MGISIKQNTDGSAGLAGPGGGDGEMVILSMPFFGFGATGLSGNGPSIDMVHFIASRRYIVKDVRCWPTVLEGGACTVSVKWVASGSAINTGTKPHSGTMDLNAGANTVQVATLSTTPSDLIVDAGYGVGLDFSIAALTVARGTVSVTLCPA